MQQSDTTASRYASSARRLLSRALRSSLAQVVITPLVSPRRVDDYLELVDPAWSLTEVRARVTAVHRETSDVTSLWLSPNDNWRGHRAGQHVQLTVTIDGARQTRSFSLSSAPGPGQPLRLTIKAHDKGLVSRWVHTRARVGDVVTLSAAQGKFVLPATPPSELLFISGGSGLTPLVAMAQELVRSNYRGKLTWLHYERDEVPLEQELRALVSELRGAKLHVQHTRGSRASDGDGLPRADVHLTEARLAQLVPQWQAHEVFVCGPRGLMSAVNKLYAEHGLAARVHSEHFQAMWQSTQVTSVDVGGSGRLVFARSGKQSAALAGVSLLEQAERAGLEPQHGCRMGICHTCTCKKLSGTVRNELTGETSDARDEEIQLCIHTPLSDVSLDL